MSPVRSRRSTRGSNVNSNSNDEDYSNNADDNNSNNTDEHVRTPRRASQAATNAINHKTPPVPAARVDSAITKILRPFFDGIYDLTDEEYVFSIFILEFMFF